MTTQTPGSGLLIDGLTRRYGATSALENAHLHVKSGEFMTLLGPSGSGKTTLLRLIAGFDTPTSGRIVIDGRDVSTLSPAERDIGMVFQHYALFPHLTVGQNIGYGLAKRKWPKNDRERRIQEMLSMVRLDGFGDRLPRQLSGGQQQRVALARALAYKPRILLMDEPLGALDRALRIEMEIELRRIHEQLNTTFIFVTHDQQEALALSQRITIMNSARIEAVDTPENLYQHPPTEFVASFFVNANILPVTVLSSSGSTARIRYRDMEIDCFSTSELSGEARLAVRRRSARRRIDSPGLSVHGKVIENILLGDDTRIALAMPDNTRFVAELPTADARHFAVGDEAELHVSAADVVAFPKEGMRP